MLKRLFTHVLPDIALQPGLRTFAEVAEGAGATAPAAEGRPEACHNLTKAGVWPSLRACCSWYRGVGKVEERRLPYAAGLSSVIPMIGAEHARGQCTCLFPPDGASICSRLDKFRLWLWPRYGDHSFWRYNNGGLIRMLPHGGIFTWRISLTMNGMS